MTETLAEHLTRTQAAHHVGLSPTRVDQLRREGRLDAVPTPLGHLYTRASLDAFLAERAQPKGPDHA